MIVFSVDGIMEVEIFDVLVVEVFVVEWFKKVCKKCGGDWKGLKILVE